MLVLYMKTYSFQIVMIAMFVVLNGCFQFILNDLVPDLETFPFGFSQKLIVFHKWV